jgi:beta-galactosidase
MGIERDSLLGIYRALFPTNVPLDYVHIDQLTPELASKYKLIYLPYPLMLPAKVGPVLAGYVKNGGALVSEARPGWNDERGWASDIVPAFGLHEVFGAREAAIRTAPAKSLTLQWTGNGIPGLAQGDRIPGRLFEETLEPVGPNARAVASGPQGTAAIASTYGKGKTLLLGTYLSGAFETTQDAGLRRFYTGLLEWAGIGRPVEATGDAEVRMLESGGDRLVFAFNHQNAPAEVTLKIPGEWSATDLITGAAVPSLTKKIGARDVWVLRLKPAK